MKKFGRGFATAGVILALILLLASYRVEADPWKTRFDSNYAEKLLRDHGHPGDPDFGNAIYSAHLILSQAALDKNVAQRATIERRAEDIAADKKRLEPQRTIRQLDVTQDTILTATKLTAAQLISFVLREYLPSMPMTPQTFVQRVLCIHGRKEIGQDHELVVFYENPRDPLINDALRKACERLNRRELRRDDRRLRFAVEPSPAKHGRSD